MYKTYTGKLDKIREEIKQINSVKFISGVSYTKCMELNKKLNDLKNKYEFYQFILEKK